MRGAVLPERASATAPAALHDPAAPTVAAARIGNESRLAAMRRAWYHTRPSENAAGGVPGIPVLGPGYTSRAFGPIHRVARVFVCREAPATRVRGGPVC